MVFDNICVLVPLTKVALALEELKLPTILLLKSTKEIYLKLPIPPEIVVCIKGIFDNNFWIENNFTKYLRESSW